MQLGALAFFDNWFVWIVLGNFGVALEYEIPSSVSLCVGQTTMLASSSALMSNFDVKRFYL